MCNQELHTFLFSYMIKSHAYASLALNYLNFFLQYQSKLLSSILVCPHTAIDVNLTGHVPSTFAEVIYETFPRLFKTKFESGMLDEILFLGLPREHRLPSGLIMLEYGKAVQESIYENFRIVHEGPLRVIFRPDLKVSSTASRNCIET